MGQSWALWLIWLHLSTLLYCHARLSACRIADGGVILERTPSQAPAAAPAEKEEKKSTKEKEDGMKTPLLPSPKSAPSLPLFFSIDSLLAQF